MIFLKNHTFFRWQDDIRKTFRRDPSTVVDLQRGLTEITIGGESVELSDVLRHRRAFTSNCTSVSVQFFLTERNSGYKITYMYITIMRNEYIVSMMMHELNFSVNNRTMTFRKATSCLSGVSPARNERAKTSIGITLPTTSKKNRADKPGDLAAGAADSTQLIGKIGDDDKAKPPRHESQSTPAPLVESNDPGVAILITDSEGKPQASLKSTQNEIDPTFKVSAGQINPTIKTPQKKIDDTKTKQTPLKRASLEHSDTLLTKTVSLFARQAKFYSHDDSDSSDITLGLPARQHLASEAACVVKEASVDGGSTRRDVSSVSEKRFATPRKPTQSPSFYDLVVDLNRESTPLSRLSHTGAYVRVLYSWCQW